MWYYAHCGTVGDDDITALNYSIPSITSMDTLQELQSFQSKQRSNVLSRRGFGFSCLPLRRVQGVVDCCARNVLCIPDDCHVCSLTSGDNDSSQMCMYFHTFLSLFLGVLVISSVT